jgi:hypothetical protein
MLNLKHTNHFLMIQMEKFQHYRFDYIDISTDLNWFNFF